MVLGAQDPQTLTNLGELVPMKTTFDNLVIGVPDFILLRNMNRVWALLFSTSKVSEKMWHFKKSATVLITFPLVPSECNWH